MRFETSRQRCTIKGQSLPRRKMSPLAHRDRYCAASECLLSGGEFNRSTQHPSLEHTDCWCRSNFSIKGQEIRHRSRSFERLRRYPPVLAALPALSALCLQLQHKPCPCMSLHMHAIPTWRIRVKGCCVDRLSPPVHSDRAPARPLQGFWGLLFLAGCDVRPAPVPS